MNKLIVILKGGIGNQLFIYAAAKRLALANNAELVLDVISGFKNDHIYKRQFQLNHFNIKCRKANSSEILINLSLFRRAILFFLNQLRPSNKKIFIRQVQDEFDQSLLTAIIKGTAYFEGYWQSEEYFKDIEINLRYDLILKPPKDSMNILMYDKIKLFNSIAIHVRFYDAKTALDLNNKLKNYYKKSVDKMKKLIPNGHFFIFSDNPEEAILLLDIPFKNFTVVNFNNYDNQEYADILLMSNCKNFILSNSSFGWWSAWLAESKNNSQFVIVPKYRFDGLVEVPLIDNFYPNRWFLM